MLTLNKLEIGKTADITSVGGEGALRQHLLDMGLIPGAEITMVKHAPMGDPIEVRIHSYALTLRLADAAKIEIKNVRDTLEITDRAIIISTGQIVAQGGKQEILDSPIARKIYLGEEFRM